MLRRIVITVVILLGLTHNAHAYLDPGTGSYLLQIFLATIFGAMFSLKLFGKKIMDFFRNLFSRE